jgi:zinc transport system permease protein
LARFNNIKSAINMTANAEFLEMMRMAFVQRALLVGTLTAVACSLLGVFLVPRRFSMIGDGLAHFALAAVGLALCLRWTPMWLVLPAMVFAALIILRAPARPAVFGDAMIGMLSVTGIALGVLLASVARGFNADLLSYLFGDILTVSPTEAVVVVVVSALVIATVAALFHELMAITVDPDHARVLGIRRDRLDRWIAVLVALTVAVGMRTAGALLISSFLIFPAASALQIGRTFRSVLMWAGCFGLLAVLIGLTAALLFDLPAGAAMALVNAVIFAAACIRRRVRR